MFGNCFYIDIRVNSNRYDHCDIPNSMVLGGFLDYSPKAHLALAMTGHDCSGLFSIDKPSG